MDERELDALRELMISLAPGLRADVDAMTHVMREMVQLERTKMGLDRPGGKLVLELNQSKKTDRDPDLVGIGWVSGRAYRVSGFVSRDKKLQITLAPRNQTNEGSAK